MLKFSDLKIGDIIYYEYDCRLIGKAKILDIIKGKNSLEFVNDSSYIIRVPIRFLDSSEHYENHYADDGDCLSVYSDKEVFRKDVGLWITDITNQYANTIK